MRLGGWGGAVVASRARRRSLRLVLGNDGERVDAGGTSSCSCMREIVNARERRE